MSVRDALLCLIGTRRYVLDVENITWGTVRPTRQGVDQGAGAGETSLSNEVVWRRVRENWVGGAGQEYADLVDAEDESSSIQFSTSSNIDCWTQRQLTLTRGRTSLHTAVGALFVAPCQVSGGGGFFVVDGTSVYVYEADSRDGTSSQLTAAPATLGASPLGVASFGGTELFVVTGTGFEKVTYTAPATIATAAFGAVTGDMIAACGSRLLAADGPEIFELSAVGAKTTIYTHANAAFVWRGAIASTNGIYAWGDTGGAGQIFYLGISDATGAIDPPIPAASLPTGEYVTVALAHAGVVVLGTNLGVRLAVPDTNSGLSYGALVDDPGAATGLTSAGRFVYVAAETSPHLWRLDLSRFSDELLLMPAFAADTSYLDGGTTVGATAVTTSVVEASGSDPATPVVAVVSATEVSFLADAVGGVGLYPTSGTIDLGWFTWGIGEVLSLDSITVECDALPGGSTHTVTAYVDTPELSGALTLVNDFTENPTLTGFAPFDIRARRFRVRLVLEGDQVAGTAPVVRSITLRATPAPFMSDGMILPVLIRETVESEGGQLFDQDVFEEWSYLLGLRDSRERIPLAIGEWTATARIESLEVQAGGLGGGNGLDGYAADGGFLKGAWEVRLVTVQSESTSTPLSYGADESLLDANYGGAYA